MKWDIIEGDSRSKMGSYIAGWWSDVEDGFWVGRFFPTNEIVDKLVDVAVPADSMIVLKMRGEDVSYIDEKRLFGG